MGFLQVVVFLAVIFLVVGIVAFLRRGRDKKLPSVIIDPPDA
jgi:hypothetical protein